MYIYIYVYTYTYIYVQTAIYWYTCHTRSILFDLLIRPWVWYTYTQTHVHVHTYMYMYMYIQILCGAIAFCQTCNIMHCNISWRNCWFRIWLIVWRASWGREECWIRPTIAILADCASILVHTGSDVKSFGFYRDQSWSDPTSTTLDCKVLFESSDPVGAQRRRAKARKIKITIWICTGKYRGIQIQSKSQFKFVPRDTDEYEFFDFD